MASNPPNNPFPVPSPDNLLSGVEGAIPGAGWILDLVKATADIPAILLAAIQTVEAVHPVDVLTGLAQHFSQGLQMIVSDKSKIWEFVTANSVGQFYSEMLHIGLEVDPSQFDAEAQQGLKVVDSMLGFAFILQFAVAALEGMGEGILGGRFTEALVGTIAKIPEELGISWVLGTAIEQGFETAVGESIREGINRQKRGNRIAWQQLRILLKQHILDDTQLTKLLENQGFPDEQIEWLRRLRDVQLPIGDLQQMYLSGIMTPAEVKTYISELGFAADDTERLFTLYIDKAETSSGTELRTTARALFTNQLITEDQYRQILTDSHFPELEIAADIRAVNLVHEVGRVQQSVSLIKSRYLHKLIPAEVAVSDLRTLNYSLDYAMQLVQSWDLPPLHPKHGLNQSKLLSYFISGLLSEAQLRDGLAALNVDSSTIDFLVKHPSAANGARVLKLGPNMVLQAYVEGAITEAQLPDMFKKVGVQPDDVSLWVDKAVYRKSHTKGTATYTAHLSPAEIISAFKYGIFDENTAHERLQQLGYSPDDATIKLEIENKGVFQPPVPPTFPNLQAALDYLASQGYIWTPPIDPKIQAAESMLAAAGYGFIPPPATLPPPPIIPPGVPPPIAP